MAFVTKVIRFQRSLLHWKKVQTTVIRYALREDLWPPTLWSIPWSWKIVCFILCVQHRSCVPRQTVFHPSPSFITETSNLPRIWIYLSFVGMGFVYFALPSCSDSTKGHLASWRLSTDIYFVVTGSSSVSCSAVCFLPKLFWFLFLGACLSSSSPCKIFSPLAHSQLVTSCQESVVRPWASLFQYSFPPPQTCKLRNSHFLYSHSLAIVFSPKAEWANWFLCECSIRVPHHNLSFDHKMCSLYCISHV